MSVKSVQFAVAAHIMAALGYFPGEEISSTILADSVNADPTFVRKSLSKLSKAGLVVTKRGKSGASMLSRSPRQITLLDIYRARDRKSTRLNSSHGYISYAVFCLKKKKRPEVHDVLVPHPDPRELLRDQLRA